MKKRRLFFFLSMILLVCLFAMAALCNLCGASARTDDSGKIDIDRSGPGPDSPSLPAGEEEGLAQPGQEDGRPTIRLRIYEGPLYSEADDVCYYRVEATVTGDPMPQRAVFSKDDSQGAWGPFRAQVNLTRAQPSYVLRAEVTTTSGTDSDSIEIRWGCPE